MCLCPGSVCMCPDSIQIRYKGIKLSHYIMYLRKHNMTTGEQVSIGSVNWPPSVLYACIHVCIIYVQSRVYMSMVQCICTVLYIGELLCRFCIYMYMCSMWWVRVLPEAACVKK